MVKTTFKRMFPNPENMQQYLKGKLEAKIKMVTIQPDEILIETDVNLTDTEVSLLEEFFKYGLHSIWKVVKE